MRTQSRISFPLLHRFGFAAASICLIWVLGLSAAEEPADQKKPTTEELSTGREIFMREWLANDPRGHGGDGLGPVFNDTSCVACHNLGGAGGGGPASKNVDIVTAVPATIAEVTDVALAASATPVEPRVDNLSDFLETATRVINGIRLLSGSPMVSIASEPKPEQRINIDELAKLHPGFRTTRSIVLHRFGTEPEFDKWHPATSSFGDSLAAPVFGPDELPVAVDEQVELHPLFRTILTKVLRHIGVELDSEMVNPPTPDHPVTFQTVVTRQSIRAGRPVAIQTIEMRQPVIASEPAPGRFWRIVDKFVDLSSIRQDVSQTGRQMIEFFSIALNINSEFNFDEEFGLNHDAMLARNLSSNGSRRDLLAMAVDENGTESAFASAKKNANAVLVPSQRNPTALFGAGMIDSIPDSVIEEAAQTKFRDFPAVTGRVSRLRDGRIGKFGWKGQTASLRDFTLTACAVELGLNVPGHDQAVVPYKPEYRSPGLDLTGQECDALISFLASLPAPSRSRPANADYAAYLEAGEKLFAETGCATCHTRKLGEVDGIFSDLLLHDMGPALADSGQYGTILPETPDENDDEPSDASFVVKAATNGHPAEVTGAQTKTAKSRSPRRSEWRTPPLWGVRDSGPYLHDGQAETIQDAIAMHGGEALPSTNRYFKLSHEKRQQLLGFLKSLTAPQASDLR